MCVRGLPLAATCITPRSHVPTTTTTQTHTLQAHLPGADLDMSVEEYARIICAVLDIPVYGSVVQSMHVMFTLYNEFKSNQHFANLDAAAAASAAASNDAAMRAIDHALGEGAGGGGGGGGAAGGLGR